MLFTLTTTHSPATDLGYLLHKHPARVQHFDLAFGQVHIFYPEATEDRCTAAMLLDIDPVGLVRGKSGFTLSQYVNDRPYAASSFLSVAIAQVYGTALSGRSKDRPELVDTAIPLTAQIDVLPCKGGVDLLQRLFEPLGYELTADPQPLDPQFPQWGESYYYSVTLEHTLRLSELLSHIYVLIPVLDNEKHYYVGDEEVDKLLRYGEGWLEQHPEKNLITRRYLKYQRSLQQQALVRLVDETDETPVTDEKEERIERPLNLHQQRLGTVISVLRAIDARRVLDLGCGEGRLLKQLLDDTQFTQILGMDVSVYALEKAKRRLKLERLPDYRREQIELIHGSLMYRDSRLEGFDAAAVVEVIEHLDPPRLAAFERVLFGFARPQMVVITTPNAEYNALWESLPAGEFRHRDHRFEWTRAEFRTWAGKVAERYGYTVRFLPIGDVDANAGSPSQMGVFEQEKEHNK